MNQNAEPIIRLTRPNDMSALQTLDLKSYQYPLPLPEWQGYVNGSGKEGEARIIVVEVLRKAVGYAMWTDDLKENGVHLQRVGVIPQARGNGFGSLLVEACLKHAYEKLCDEVRIIVPHIHCDPEDPDDVSKFLRRLEFETTGDIFHSWKKMYGQDVDGYVFRRKIYATPPV